MSIEADEDEHSIEMQLPYIAKVLTPILWPNWPQICAGDAARTRQLHHCPSHGRISLSQLGGEIWQDIRQISPGSLGVFCHLLRLLPLGGQVPLHPLWLLRRRDLSVHPGKETTHRTPHTSHLTPHTSHLTPHPLSLSRPWTRLVCQSLRGWIQQASPTTSNSTATPSVVAIPSVSSSTWLQRLGGESQTVSGWISSSSSTLKVQKWEIPGSHLLAMLLLPSLWIRKCVFFLLFLHYSHFNILTLTPILRTRYNFSYFTCGNISTS